MEEELREYVVTLYNHEDLEAFYEDMETPGGALYIPNRAVDVSLRRPISRNTHYLLTEEEAELIKNDPRVWDCELKQTIRRQPSGFTQQSNDFDKNETISSGNTNWGLLRSERGLQIANWGTDGDADQEGTITITSSGKNVDVVIIDGYLNPDHPEFAVNPDGSGGSRVVPYNWYQHNPQVLGTSAGTFVYPTGSKLSNGEDNHGMHVAGTAVGNTQGWARDANIYNISPYSYYWVNEDYGEYTNYAIYNNATDYHIDYIREFHKNKPINPITKIKNPTITTGSYYSPQIVPIGDFNSITYRGQTYTTGDPNDWKIRYTLNQSQTQVTSINYQKYSTSFAADMQDAINEGVIFVSVSGNTSGYIDKEGGPDYNNSINHYLDDGVNPAGDYSFYCHRGSDNATAPGVICVGSISELKDDSKAGYSGNGPRVDVYAPGTWIISSVHSGVKTPSVTVPVVDDSRNSSFKYAKFRGTSMACPQVTGILACALEQNPRMNATDCLSYLKQYSKYNQITDGDGTFQDDVSLLGSENKYLYYHKQRQTSGYVTAQQNNNVRKSSGMTFPRRRFV